MRTFPKTAALVAALHAVTFSLPAGAQSPAPAPAVGNDVIHLKGGGILRGTMIDAIPHMQARIQLATGEIATVPWDQIDQIEHASAPAPGGGTGPAPTPTGPVTPPPKPPPPSVNVYVHIDGSDDVQLLQDKTGDGDWATVCYAPCDKPMPTGPSYRVDAPGMKQSSSFKLSASDGGQHDTVSVHGASTPWFVIGCIAIPVGGIAAYFGLIFGLTGSLVSSTGTSGGSGIEAAGWTTFFVGAGAVVGGIILVVTNMRTTVTQDVAGGAAVGALRADALRPRPTWSETPAAARGLPPAVGVPLFTGRF